jgi:hypothetical protein
MIPVVFDLDEVYELRRHLKAFLAKLDQRLVETHAQVLTKQDDRDKTPPLK